MKKSALKCFEDFEIHHKVISFLVVIIATILLTRFIVYYLINPSPQILGFELHHFDYGLLLLAVVALLMLFGKMHFKTYIIMTAVSLGLIIDELWFVRKQIGGSNAAIYNPSLTYALILALIVVLVAFLISKLFNESK